MIDHQDHASASEPPALDVGDVVSVEDPLRGTSARATVTAASAGVIALRLPPATEWRPGRVGLRRLDRDGRAWYGETMCRPGEGDAELLAGAPDLWEADAIRRSARVRAGRAPVVCETYPPNAIQRDLTGVDISASGLGATGHGLSLAIGLGVRLTLDGTWQRRWVHAVVVWSSPAVHGLYSVGFRFSPQSRGEQELVLQWRDEAARRTAE